MSQINNTGTSKSAKSPATKVKKAVQTRPRSHAFDAIHSAASGLHKAGMIDQATMRKFDKL